MKLKRILIFFPHNYSEINCGVHRRFSELIRYFAVRNFSIDLLTLRNYEDPWFDQRVPEVMPEIEDIYFYDHSKGLKRSYINLRKFYELGLTNQFKWLKSYQLPDYAFPGLKALMNDLLKLKEYHYVLISYVQWASLIDQKLPYPVNTVITIEDILTINAGENLKLSKRVSRFLEEEIRRIDMFDQAFFISKAELELLKDKLKRVKLHYLPVFLEGNLSRRTEYYKFDLLFVGSNNKNNQKAIGWFITCVYPLLRKNLRILFVGNIIDSIPQISFAEKLKYVNDLSAIYVSNWQNRLAHQQ